LLYFVVGVFVRFRAPLHLPFPWTKVLPDSFFGYILNPLKKTLLDFGITYLILLQY
jgi:hypothetical protein